MVEKKMCSEKYINIVEKKIEVVEKNTENNIYSGKKRDCNIILR